MEERLNGSTNANGGGGGAAYAYPYQHHHHYPRADEDEDDDLLLVQHGQQQVKFWKLGRDSIHSVTHTTPR